MKEAHGIGRQGNAKQNHNEPLLTPTQRPQQTTGQTGMTGVGEDMETVEALAGLVGSKRRGRHGEQLGGSLRS